MADIYIPSVSSGGGFDSNKQIERIMELERIPLTRLEEERSDLQDENNLWASVKRTLSSLLESSQSMYQFNNPFSARVVESSNSRVLTANGTNNSLLGTYSVTVEQKATSDRFASSPVASNLDISEGSYRFSVGETDLEIPFSGGSLADFAESITLSGNRILTASVIQVNNTQSVLLLASRRTGAENALEFHGAAKEMAETLGVLGAPSQELLSHEDAFLMANDTPSTALNAQESIQFFAKSAAHSIRIQSNQEIELQVEDSQGNVFTERGTEINVSRDTIDIAKLTLLNNSDSQIEATISGFTKSQPVPLNPVSRAQNSVISVEGIRIERSTNELDEILPGISLSIQSASDTPVELTVNPDNEYTKQEIVRLVGNYNVAMQRINLLSRDDPAIVDEVSFNTDSERDEALEELGSLRGDTVLTRLRSELVRSTSENVPNREAFTFLSEIGISTNQQSLGAIRTNSLRGYLEINEEALDSALSESFVGVSKLFGNDSDGDQIIDTGFAYRLSNAIRQYTQNGGVIDTRTQRITNQIRESDTQIDRYSDRLESREAELRRQFAVMERQVQSLQNNTNALNGFLGQGQ